MSLPKDLLILSLLFMVCSGQATTTVQSAPTTLAEQSAPTTLPEQSVLTTLTEQSAPTPLPEQSPPTTLPEQLTPTTLTEQSTPTALQEQSEPTTLPEQTESFTPSTSTTTTSDFELPDLYSLDTLDDNPELFGQIVVGILQSNPYERHTVQRLLHLLRDSEDTGEANEFFPQLLRGYFAILPDLLNGTDNEGILNMYINDTEIQLREHVNDNSNNYESRNETYYYDLDESTLERPLWLLSKFSLGEVLFSRRTYIVILKYLISIPYEKYQPDRVNDQCYTDVVHTIRSFYIGKQWAIDMVDATGKPPIGLFEGNLNWIGQYDQCNKIVADRSNISTQETIEENVFQGSYCDVSMDTDKALPGVEIPKQPGYELYLKIGLCFPSTCNSGDVHKIMQNLEIAGNKFPEIDKTRCFNESPTASGGFSTDVLAVIATLLFLTYSVIMGIYVLLTILTTLIEGILWYEYDYGLGEEKLDQTPECGTKSELDGEANDAFHESNNTDEKLEITSGESQVCESGVTSSVNESERAAANKTKPSSPPGNKIFKHLVKTFSLYTNVPALMSTKQPKGAIKSLDGLRVFSINWIILGHVLSIGAASIPHTLSNAKIFAEIMKTMSAQSLFNATLGVDTFFFISGLLVSYLFLKRCKRSNPKSVWINQMVIYYRHRLIRILPLYGIVILGYTAFSPYLGSGPLYDWQSAKIRACKANWWTNLLFINNFVNTKEQCMGWSWYLANDMQFFIAAPLILFPLFLLPILGLLIIALAMGACIAANAYMWYGTEGRSFLQDADIYHDAYIKPYCRIGPYLIGIILGYILYKKYKLTNKLLLLAGWLLCVFTMGVVVFVQYEDMRIHGVDKPTWGATQRAAYEALSRSAWAMAIAWIVYTCNIGYGGFIAHILNWPGWAPLSKITFAAYLIHPVVIFVYVGNRRDLHHMDYFSVTYMYCGYTLLTYIGGAVVTLIFEIPAAAIEKLLFAKPSKTKSKGKNNDKDASSDPVGSTSL